jgi:hypothetical protein
VSEPAFVTDEALSDRNRGVGAFALNLRLFGSLPFFLKILPLSLLTIVLSSAAPSVFRWYAGHVSDPAHSSGFALEGMVLITGLAIFFRDRRLGALRDQRDVGSAGASFQDGGEPGSDAHDVL